VHLSILDGGEVMYVDKIDSPEPVGAYTRMGGRAPAYCVATGKALLSAQPREALEPVLAELRPHSEFTITDPDRLLEELAAVRRQGYAFNRGEWRAGVRGIASVIYDAAQAPIAAVGVSGPSFRLDDEARCAELAAMVMKAARDISAYLGYRSDHG
jgi:DNA-binding IclR family transcriptional regulator